jgi:hypothetical protein
MSDDRDVIIGSAQFKLNKIDAMKQFHITRRLAPMLGEMITAAAKLKANGSQDDQLKSLEPVIAGISKLNDKDAEFVLFGLLASVEMQQVHGNWAKIANDNMLMIQNLELPVMLQLAGRSFMYNMAGFFNGLPQK